MRRFVYAAIAAVALSPATAAAKEIRSAQVCGADGCQAVDHPDESLLMGAGPPSGSGPSRPEPFVRLRVVVGGPDEHDTVRSLFFPRSGWVLASDERLWMRPQAPARMQRLARRVHPFPASRVPPGVFDLDPRPVTTPGPAPKSAARTGDDGFPWIPVAVGPIVLALALWLARRRRIGYGLAGAGQR